MCFYNKTNAFSLIPNVNITWPSDAWMPYSRPAAGSRPASCSLWQLPSLWRPDLWQLDVRSTMWTENKYAAHINYWHNLWWQHSHISYDHLHHHAHRDFVENIGKPWNPIKGLCHHHEIQREVPHSARTSMSLRVFGIYAQRIFGSRSHVASAWGVDPPKPGRLPSHEPHLRRLEPVSKPCDLLWMS